jgi:hypothetical protein
MATRRVHGMTLVNRNGGYCHPGEMYTHRTKMEVGQAYMALFVELFLTRPSTRAVATKAKVRKGYASKVIEELVRTGTLVDPEILKQK